MSTPVGGQAVLDGVMMRRGERWTLATRADDGTITVSEHAAPAWASGVSDLPLLRGVAALAETVVLGGRATILASRRRTGATEARPGEIVAVVLGAVFAVAAFGLVPTWLAHHATDGGWLFHLTEATLRIGALVGYLALLGRSPTIARVWGYHGAEHKAVNAHERGLPVEFGTVAAMPRQHRRCGTTFLLLVAVLAIAVHAVIGEPALPVLLASRVLALPLIAALAYEVIRVAGRPDAPGWLRVLTVPGLWFQSLTTREPDADQIEVAVAALAPLLGDLAADEPTEREGVVLGVA